MMVLFLIILLRIIFGNSLVEVPKLEGDLIFVDGGHSFRDAMMDIVNCMKLSNSGTAPN